VDLRVTPRTESDHQMQHRLARNPMMDSRIGIPNTLNHRLQGDIFLKYVHCGLICTGILLLIQSVRR
jgi:hypothetical protein